MPRLKARIAFTFLASVLLLAGAAAAGEGAAEGAPQAEKKGEMTEIVTDEAVIYTENGCSANFDCGDGNTVSCTGNQTCTVNSYVGYVECDGNRTTCPNSCSATLWCECTFKMCYSTSGDCVQGPGYIQCDGGFQITCDFPRDPCGGPPSP